ncbi:MAG: anti-sigma F factor antagonist [Clostridia bacterium]|jgi:stage II sporulation protein AA (anti-sigma F factor antagonist)
MLKYRREADTLTVTLSGELDHHTSEYIREELDRLIEDVSIKHLILDLRCLQFMDSSGIGVVLGRYRTMAKRKGSVSVKNTTPHIDKIFEVSGLYKIIHKL